MKNYYEILEVNKNASTEVIEKAYKTLVKKYHPDLQNTPEEKSISEAKIKEINEAYEILENHEKRAEYDTTLAEAEALEKERIIQEQLEHELRNQKKSNNNYNNYNNNYNNSYNNNINDYSNNNYNNKQVNNNIHQNVNNSNTNNNNNNVDKQFQQDYEDAINKAYHDAYIQDMKNRGYRIKYKKTWNERVRSLIALLITIGIILLILQLPFVKDYFNSLYRDNEVIRNIVDFFAGWFK